ncbi:MAG: TonB-dependent receptor [Janthinobacterium lividum]
MVTQRRAATIILALYAGTAYAAEHHGRVLFSGLPVPGATITASRNGQKLSTVTDTQGLFQFADLAAGEWTLSVQMFGFAPVDAKVVIPATAGSMLELQMLPLAEVLASADKASAAPMITNRLPAAAVKPAAAGEGAVSAPPSTEPDRAADGMLINGSENNAATSKYSISPAFGTRRAGTKALYTGSLGAQLSDSAFDARPYSLTGLLVPKATYNRFTGTATLGGPIRIPHLLLNGPSFFLGYQWTRDREATTLSGLVPTTAQRSGDLSSTVTSQGTPVTVVNPATGLPFAGNIPVSTQAAALLQLYPLPNLSGNTRYNYQTQVLNNTHVDALQSRLDKSIGRRDSFYGGLAFRSVRSDIENLFHFRDERGTLGIDANVNWTHRFPRQLLLETGYRFSRFRTSVQPYFASRSNISGDAGIDGNEQSASNWGPPDLQFASGIAALNDVQSAFNRNRTDAVFFTGTWNHRKHVVKIGGDFRRQEFNQLQQQNPRGSFTFTGNATQGSNTTGSDFADFLFGVPDTSNIAFGNADKYFRQSVTDLYVSDDWRVQPNLTLNVGLRWDYGAPMTELKGRLVNLDVAPGFSAVTPVLGYSPKGALTGQSYPASLVRPDYRKFQPRLGLSWRPLPTSPLVVRAGYGIYVDTSIYLNSAQSMSQQSPLSKSLSVSNSGTCPLTLANGFRDCAGTTSNTFAIDPNFRTGYAQTWRLSAQQDLPSALVLTATYLGTKGTRGPQEFLPNTYAPGSTAFCAACPRGFVYRTSNGASIRHAGEVQLRRRLRSGLTATLDYVYAHSIDNVSLLGGNGYTSFGSTADVTSPAESIAQNWLDLRAERSRSSFDQRHLLKFSLQYTTGVGARGGTFLTGWRGTLLKNWTVASQLSAGSGLPQTPIYLNTVPGTGFTGTIRPNRTSAQLYTGPSGYFLNTGAYSEPGTGQWGNAGRYSIEGPNAVTLDSSFARTFKLRDPTSFDLRVDATNLVNHVVYTGWNTITNSTTFGLPASTRQMRSLQISGRLRF